MCRNERKRNRQKKQTLTKEPKITPKSITIKSSFQILVYHFYQFRLFLTVNFVSMPLKYWLRATPKSVNAKTRVHGDIYLMEGTLIQHVIPQIKYGKNRLLN